LSKPEPSLRTRAVAILARREHSRAELARKLAPHAESREEVEAVLDDLAARKLLSDERYAEARTSTLVRKFGVSRIAHELRRQGVAEETVTQATETARATELERAREAWRRKFGVVAPDRAGRAKQMRFLQSRGFSFDVIRKVVGGETDDDE
jgi:regulatory protein